MLDPAATRRLGTRIANHCTSERNRESRSTSSIRRGQLSGQRQPTGASRSHDPRAPLPTTGPSRTETKMDYVKPADVATAMVETGRRKLALAPGDLLIR